MKYITLILLIIVFSAIDTYSQQVNVSGDIKKSLTNGDAKNLSLLFNSTIDITLPNIEGTYSRSQAELILKDFFDKNKPVSFKINHEGSSNKGSKYIIGTLSTKDFTFRTYILIKEFNQEALIQQLQIEED